jgi:hypothetical protein
MYIEDLEVTKTILEGHLFHKFKPTDKIIYVYIMPT